MPDPRPPFKMLTETNMEQYRFYNWESKEPETIAWIRSFRPDSVFFDVGANVGVYSLFCAIIHPACTVFSFEPDLKNFIRLQHNIGANEFLNIIAMPFAISDRDGCGIFYESSPIIASSGGQLNAALCNGQASYNVVEQTIDSLVTLFGIWSSTSIFPNHIKVDIDGQELRVVRGMKATLENPELRSVLIEVDRDKDKASEAAEIESTFYAAGFTSDNRWNAMPNHSRFRRAKEKIFVENIIFTR